MPHLSRIITGGQTGADRAALDAALARGIPIGGWVPAGRDAEDGSVPSRYEGLKPVTEADERLIPDTDVARFYPDATLSDHVRLRSRLARTRRNVLDADATLIFARGALTGGTSATEQYARELGKPVRVIDPDRCGAPESCAQAIAEWLTESRIAILNVAGPGQGDDPRIYDDVCRVLGLVFGRSAERAGRSGVLSLES